MKCVVRVGEGFEGREIKGRKVREVGNFRFWFVGKGYFGVFGKMIFFIYSSNVESYKVGYGVFFSLV